MKKLIILLAALSLIAVAVPQAHRNPTKTSKPPAKLKSDLNKIKNEKKKLKERLKQATHRVNLAKHDLKSIDGALNEASDRLECTANRLSESRKRQKDLNSQLDVVNERLKVKREEVRHRLKLIYVRGDATVFAALGTSKSVGQFASRKYAFERIAHKDRELFDEVKDLQAQVRDKKQRVDQVVAEITGLKKEQQSQQTQLEEKRDDKAAFLGQLKHKQREIQKILAELEAEENEIEAQIAAFSRSSGHHLPAFKGRFLKPVPGPITSGYGNRIHPVLGGKRLHKGVDIGARTGVPIKAAADGIVITARWSKGYGNMIIVDHGGGISTLYGHCSRLFVSSGQRVFRGQKIGAVGSTGLTTGPHLHWEVRKSGKAVNPAGWF